MYAFNITSMSRHKNVISDPMFLKMSSFLKKKSAYKMVNTMTHCIAIVSSTCINILYGTKEYIFDTGYYTETFIFLHF